jgi:hypothetical protein
MHYKKDINLIILGMSITNENLCEQYEKLCMQFSEGFFLNMDFREIEKQSASID